jgi:hypothetical protein
MPTGCNAESFEPAGDSISGRHWRWPLKLTDRTAVPSIRHRLRKHRYGGIMRSGPVNDRGQYMWRDERKWRQEANAPLHLAFTLRDLGERPNAT